MMTLKEVPIGSTVTIKKVCATGPLKRRIVDMGLTKGTGDRQKSRATGRSIRSNCTQL